MNTLTLPSHAGVARAAMRREWLSHRLNRFLHAHLLLVAAAAVLPLLTPGDTLSRGAPWWILHSVLYALSLSSVLIGLSSAQSDNEEYSWILGHPLGPGPWLMGKLGGLLLLVGGATLLLGLPILVMVGASQGLATVVCGAVLVCLFCTLLGFAIGVWVRDGVRGLIMAVGLWFVAVFGLDLLLLSVAGAPWVQANPSWWVAALMSNPLDAYRLTVLFSVEKAAFSGLGADGLAGWWSLNAPLWLATLTAIWAGLLGTVAWFGLKRPVDL